MKGEGEALTHLIIDGCEALVDTVSRVLVVDRYVILAGEGFDRDPVEVIGRLEEPRDLKIMAVRFTVAYSLFFPSDPSYRPYIILTRSAHSTDGGFINAKSTIWKFTVVYLPG